MPLPLVLASALIAALTFYAVLGGADYGGGVWDLLARGPRSAAQRDLVAHAIGPIWEANHVWLILVIVVLFTAFPPAFSRIAIGLHVPIVLLLIGIVFRGSAFTFRTYATEDQSGRIWGYSFAIASLFTPLLLGVIVGAISSGGVPDGTDLSLNSFFRWVAPFPFAVGFFALSLFAFLAAVYLTVEAEDEDIRNDFRLRAIWAELTAGLIALIVFLLANKSAPQIRERLTFSWWTWPLQVSTAILAVCSLWALLARAYKWARFFAVTQVTLILWGWSFAQFPYLVVPDITIYSAAAPRQTLSLLLTALCLGALLLFPSLLYLFRVFKR